MSQQSIAEKTVQKTHSTQHINTHRYDWNRWNRSICFHFTYDEREWKMWTNNGQPTANSNSKLIFSVVHSFQEHVFTFKFYTFREWIWNFLLNWRLNARTSLLSARHMRARCRCLGHRVQCSISNGNWKVENEHWSALISFIWWLCGGECERFNNNACERVCIELFRSFSVHSSTVNGHTRTHSIFFSRQFHFAWHIFFCFVSVRFYTNGFRSDSIPLPLKKTQ